jgi:hypothetical protein
MKKTWNQKSRDSDSIQGLEWAFMYIGSVYESGHIQKLLNSAAETSGR